MGAVLELPAEAGSWVVEIRRESAYLLRGEADDLGAYPGVGFSCPEDALPGLAVTLKQVQDTAAYQQAEAQPTGPCAIVHEGERVHLHCRGVIGYGTLWAGRWRKASQVEIGYGDIPALLRKVESLLAGQYR
ncbi:hypothetical protein [Amycolatopsis sp. NPDC059021]|uniref:hypothetical protein n=1 Tax=Amycolatopsis sp. NPDC059021 TaxID=3346704 RepID=UPI0036733807